VERRLNSKTQILIFGLTFLALVSRRPDALFSPQLFGEAGIVYLMQAHSVGWSAVFHPRVGYFTLLPRLVTGLALLLPMRMLPLVENLVALTIQALVVTVLLSSRTRGFGPLSLRALMAIVYVALPDASEVHATLVNSQWHLALLAAILVVSESPRTAAPRVFDVVVIAISGLTGPFSIFLFPIAVLFWWVRRDTWRLVSAGLVGATALIQAAALITENAAGTRLPTGLGATPKRFVELMGGHFFIGSLLGGAGPAWLQNDIVLAAAFLLGTACLAYCLWKASLEIKLLTIFALLVFAGSLRSPLLSGTMTQWEALRILPVGVRYWFFPMVAVGWTLAWFFRIAPRRSARVAAAGVLALMSVAATRHWRYPAYPDVGFARHAEEYEAAPPGALVTLPVVPSADWAVTIPKKGTICRRFPKGMIEQRPRGPVSAQTLLSGWVVGPVEMRHVALVIEGRVVGAARPNLRRPDVDRLLPRGPQPVKGWIANVDLSNVGPGRHELEAWGSDADGCGGVFAVATIEKARPAMTE
jgi:hypothetical protein